MNTEDVKLIQGRPWSTTFQHLIDLFRPEGGLAELQPDPEHDPVTKYIVEIICVLDIPIFFLGRISPSRGLWGEFRGVQSTWSEGQLHGVEPISGLPRSLLDIISRCHDDSGNAERELWQWPGEVSQWFHDCHLWDCYRFACILSIRRQHLQNLCGHSMDAESSERINTETNVPETSLVLFRLLSCLSALLDESEGQQARPFQIQRLALFPIVQASLQVSLLKAQVEWREALKRMRDRILALDRGPTHQTVLLFEILDEAWESGSDEFDAVGAARRRGGEFTIF